MQAQFPKKAIHGGKIIELRKKAGHDFLDVSASMNPFVPEIPRAFLEADLSVYPDDSYSALKEKIAKVFSRNPDEICVGNGSAELIRVYCSVKLSKGKTAGIDMPTFAEYGLSAKLAGAEIVSGSDADVRFICNPNNPTGLLKTRGEMISLVEDAEDGGSDLFTDEAFIELAEHDESISDIKSDSLFVMRSITKCFSVPGIRFGFGFGEPGLIEKIETARTPWTVNAFAENFAIEVLDRYGELKESAAKITAERNYYFTEIEKLGLTHSDSKANFIVIDVKEPAFEFCKKLMNEGVLVRDCTSFGLPNKIRVAVETREKNQRVLEAIEKCLP
ncbi:MAG: histidinol-phosphate transaminase [Methanocorpusculum sp.]|nr:histidinol-phosphate transaminase [Methanocorpusculum sp.]